MRILLIDDDVNLCRVLSYQLQKAKYEVQIAHRGKDGLSLFKQHSFDIVLTDYQMPDISGIQVLKSIREIDINVIVIMITAFGSIEGALDACRIGADDYISKPFSQEQLLFVIEKAIRLKKLKEENANLHLELQNKFSFSRMVAYSEIMENVLKIATKVAQSDSTVLLLGESGTGKELIARGIHFNSRRKQKPFITVNCPAIPANLIESELFGHVKGAFTGALKDRTGKFEYADGGTVFLDEIGDLKLEIQSKLLRILQEHEFERLGENKIIKVDVRIIAATNKDLIQQMKNGNFREDLYYRLSVVPINIPPLRERIEDIPYLVDFFLRKYQKNVKLTLEEAVSNILTQYHWPGNVRELENVIERAIVLSNNKQIKMDDLPEHLTDADHLDKSKSVIEVSNFSLNEIERNAIEEALKKTQRNQTKAAELLKIPRHILIYRMKKHGISSKN